MAECRISLIPVNLSSISGNQTADETFVPSFESTRFQDDYIFSFKGEKKFEESTEPQIRKARVQSKRKQVALTTIKENYQRQGSEKKTSAGVAEPHTETAADESVPDVEKYNGRARDRASPAIQGSVARMVHKRKRSMKSIKKPFILSNKPLREKFIRTLAIVTISPILLVHLRNS